MPAYRIRRLRKLCYCIPIAITLLILLLRQMITTPSTVMNSYSSVDTKNNITRESSNLGNSQLNGVEISNGIGYIQNYQRESLSKSDMVNQPKIPHRVHQVWNNYNIHEIFVPWISSWFINHPDWEYWWWTQEDAEKLLHKIPEVEQVYNQLTDLTQKANVIRYTVIYVFGGVYADIDMESLKSFEPWTEKYYCIMMDENLEHNLAYHQLSDRGKIMITMLPCRANHPYYKLLLNNLPKYVDQNVANQHRFAGYTFDEYISSNKSESLRDDVYVEHDGHIFFPTFDPIVKPGLQRICKNDYYTLTDLYKSVCDRLISTNFANIPTDGAFTNHYWVHVNVESPNFKQMKQLDIRDIVPKQQFVDVAKEIEHLDTIRM